MNILGVEYDEIVSELIAKKPLVVVYCITYNHASYIRNALEGFVNQIVPFEMKVIVIDDASTDGTTEIIKEYQAAYPQIFHLLIAKTNTFKNKNREEIYKKIKNDFFIGKYVAYCEGDDYWTAPDKLKVQVEYMELHSDCIMTLHNAYREDMRDGKKEVMHENEPESDLSANELIRQKNGIWPTASIVVKKDFFVMPNIFLGCPVGDFPLQLYAVAHGRVHYFDSCMSVYRYMVSGSWSQRTLNDFEPALLHTLKMIEFMDEYNRYTSFEYDKAIKIRKRLFYEFIVRTYKIDIGEYLECCNQLNRKTNYKYKEKIHKIMECYRHYNSDDYLSDDVKAFIKNYDKIYIMGAGEFGRKTAIKLKRNNVEFEGFAVSSDQTEYKEVFEGKKVFKLNELDKSEEDIGLLVGIIRYGWEEWDKLKEIITMQGFKSFYNPYIIE